jgi:nicotinamidase-related amidase
MNYKYPFNSDPNGPKGISINSWLNTGRLALLVIDIQNYLTDKEYSGEFSSSHNEDYYIRIETTVLPNIKRVIDLFKELNLPIIYTRNASINKCHLDVPGLSRKRYAEELKDIKGNNYHLYADDFSSKIDKRIIPGEEDIVLTKTSSGAFCSTNIDLILRNNDISSLVFTGGLTAACVSTSVREASDRGYLCTVLDDACISATMEDHEAAITSLDKYYAWIINTEDLISKLSSD